MEPRVNRSEAASSKHLVRMVPGSARNWIAVNASSTIQPQQKNMTTLHLKKSKAQSPLRLGLFARGARPRLLRDPSSGVYAVDAPPTVFTRSVMFKASFSATLNSFVDPNGLASVHFQYGTTTDYGLTTAPETASGHSRRHIDADISGLAANTTYHFRVGSQ